MCFATAVSCVVLNVLVYYVLCIYVLILNVDPRILNFVSYVDVLIMLCKKKRMNNIIILHN